MGGLYLLEEGAAKKKVGLGVGGGVCVCWTTGFRIPGICDG